MRYKVNFKDVSNMLTPYFFRAPIYQRYLFSLIKPLSDLNDNGNPVLYFDQGNTDNTTYRGIYSAANTYAIGDISMYFGVSYRNKTKITTPEAFDDTKWIKSPRVSLYPFTLFITRFLQVDASRLVLQKYLNELFDSTNEGILLVNNATTYVTYEFNSSEEHTVDYGYNSWDSTHDYAATKEYALGSNGNAYLSNQTPNLDKDPSDSANSAYWDLISTGQEYFFNEADTFVADYNIEIPALVATGPEFDGDKFKAVVNFFNSAGRTFNGVRQDLSAGDAGYLLFTNI